MVRMITERSDVLPQLAEVFREYGYAGASLSVITDATGLGKGSLYNFFPGGKSEMVEAVLAEIEEWFEVNVFTPLRAKGEPLAAIDSMLSSVEIYFHSGERVCLVGALALNDPDDRFAVAVRRYFDIWVGDLARALKRAGVSSPRDHAIDIVGRIQGAIVLTRALDDPTVFARAMKQTRELYGC